jgi:hypothetical protein
MYLKVLFLSFFVLLAGCAGQMKKIPASAEISAFHLKEVTVNLIFNGNEIPGDTTFASQEEFAKNFEDDLVKYLKEKNIYSASSREDVAELYITLDYTRNYTHNGKALIQPYVSHNVKVYSGDSELLSFGVSNYTTKYDYFTQFAVVTQRLAYEWDQEDEPKEIDLISKTIINDLKERMDK